MRIRTIKPDFWTHPVLSRLPDFTRLIAIGLLNLADDEGYFNADKMMVRSSIMPFSEDSVSIHGALSELSLCDYIELKKHPTYGMIGLVKNFKKHQVINRPRPSTLKDYFNSVINHGGISEASLLERKGMEGKGSGGERALPYPSIENMFEYFKSCDGCDYTLEEIKIAVTALETRKTESGFWQWGKGVVIANNWHSAVSTKIQDRRDKMPSKAVKNPELSYLKSRRDNYQSDPELFANGEITKAYGELCSTISKLESAR